MRRIFVILMLSIVLVSIVSAVPFDYCETPLEIKNVGPGSVKNITIPDVCKLPNACKINATIIIGTYSAEYPDVWWATTQEPVNSLTKIAVWYFVSSAGDSITHWENGDYHNKLIWAWEEVITAFGIVTSQQSSLAIYDDIYGYEQDPEKWSLYSINSNNMNVYVRICSFDDDSIFCGSGICDPGETNVNCPEDCAICGDNIADGVEVCDGDDVPSTCEDLGYDGGALSCNAQCSGFDESACFECGDGSCDPGEDLTSCPEDCDLCGDGSCDPGEDCLSCAVDCLESGQVCCSGVVFDGECCIDSDCSENKRCTDNICELYCGNGACDPGEYCETCPEDCGECEDPCSAEGECVGGCPEGDPDCSCDNYGEICGDEEICLGNVFAHNQEGICCDNCIIPEKPEIENVVVSPVAVFIGDEVILDIEDIVTPDDVSIEDKYVEIKSPSGVLLIENIPDGGKKFTPTELGRHDVKFYVVDSLGLYSENVTTYFAVALPVDAIIKAKNSTSDIDVNLKVYIEGLLFGSFDFNGEISDTFPEYCDLEFSGFEGDIDVRLNGVNLTKDDNDKIKLDSFSAVSGYLASYAAESTYRYKNANVSISYEDSNYDVEEDLEVHICSDWDFIERSCSGEWVISESSIDEDDMKLQVDVDSFSGFSIREVAGAINVDSCTPDWDYTDFGS